MKQQDLFLAQQECEEWGIDLQQVRRTRVSALLRNGKIVRNHLGKHRKEQAPFQLGFELEQVIAIRFSMVPGRGGSKRCEIP